MLPRNELDRLLSMTPDTLRARLLWYAHFMDIGDRDTAEIVWGDIIERYNPKHVIEIWQQVYRGLENGRG